MKNYMNAYPFLFINHGEIDPEYVDKNEEIFIWFKHEVTKEEQRKIMEGCPGPIDFVYCWGKEFVYFGSGGDTYDFEIIEQYATEESRILAKLVDTGENMDEEEKDGDGALVDIEGKDFDKVYYQALTKALPLFSQAIESWIMKINDLVPVLFFYAPHRPEEDDDWGAWSKENIFDLSIPYIRNYKEKYPEVFAKDNEEQRFFGYIYDFLSHYVKTENRSIEETLKEIEFGFDLDGIKNSFDRLNLEDSRLQGNANKLYSILEKLTAEERVEYINKLKPYTQFAYYASYAANRNHDILVHKNPVLFLNLLIEKLPDSRKEIIGTFLRFIGNNLVHVSPAFRDEEKNDKTHAALAAEIVELSLKYEMDKGACINCAAYYDWCGNYEAMLRVSLEADKKFANENTIIANILYAAEKCKKTDIVEKFINKKSDDPLILANQSFSLVKSGKLREAYNLLIEHFKNKGNFNQYSLNNLLYLCNNYKMPEESILKGILDLSLKNIKNDQNYIQADFINNLLILVNNTGNFEKSFELLSDYRKKGGTLNCSLCCGYTYAASMTRNNEIIQKTIEVVLEVYNKDKSNFDNDKANIFILLGNIAGMYAILGNKEMMLKYLVMTKKVHPQFDNLKKDTDFKEYWTDKDFIKIFYN